MDWRFLGLVFGAYLIGAIPSGVLVSRLGGKSDPRLGGSGNIGATNVLRVSGRLAGALTLALDLAKGAGPTLAAALLLAPWQTALVGVAAFAGHIFPVYLHFRGGKGVATALGVWLIWSPASFLAVAAIIVFLAWRTGQMSVGSLAGCGSAPLWLLIDHCPAAMLWAAVVMSGLIVWRHKDNIVRLRSGMENKLK
ncbi:protein of unknown function DUF205 [Desulfarculus baarsii DSM 2075]|uniref:Glycerol-3-phosphate acyltransferase n=1 Tax=Desulfarculus baarsii (strain ATCC 33931 / DSM 2075 / LMG 7858 / VKM B-1802 / 2st14) TaxID=644282 RepID=E1QIM4_DESB2|nr:glycerol-3-phosphate 1-O-acyltransferase PlsY [Desulfarculus baarsii]ADK84447.1 protein of unknown function DUF205 [Desulfarculus baarsii DSM 2075]